MSHSATWIQRASLGAAWYSRRRIPIQVRAELLVPHPPTPQRDGSPYRCLYRPRLPSRFRFYVFFSMMHPHMDPSLIRNFSIIAHIDHGKSTLADRMLELTATVEKRKMREQVLDQMELERERGITIKMQPVKMRYTSLGKTYQLNLIDTPGHIDFSYEVSRSLRAVEGVILLVDATQGIEAQTLSVLDAAREHNLVVIPVVNKIDLQNAEVEETRSALAELLSEDPSRVLLVSGKTGLGVGDLLQSVVERIPAPGEGPTNEKSCRGLIFDSEYTTHRGIIVSVRMFEGSVSEGDELSFSHAGISFNAQEVGIFSPERRQTDSLASGEIGYVVTGLKEPGLVQVGDTLLRKNSQLAPIPGYQRPQPVVFASLYPEEQDDITALSHSLTKLRLSDSSLTFEEEASDALGKGFRCGFLGLLHLEIIAERLKREFNQNLIVTSPTISFEVHLRGGRTEIVRSPSRFPDEGVIESVLEPWVICRLITPPEYIGQCLQLLYEHEAEVGETMTLRGNRTSLNAEMPLRELMRGFFDALKSATKGYASLSYRMIGMREADVVRLDILLADEVALPLTRIVSVRRVEHEAQSLAQRLEENLPRQLFALKIQARARGRIIASRTLSALRKDVTGYLYGGDVTRKMKLLEKQKKGKKKLAKQGRVKIPQDVFLKLVRRS